MCVAWQIVWLLFLFIQFLADLTFSLNFNIIVCVIFYFFSFEIFSVIFLLFLSSFSTFLSSLFFVHHQFLTSHLFSFMLLMCEFYAFTMLLWEKTNIWNIYIFIVLLPIFNNVKLTGLIFFAVKKSSKSGKIIVNYY